MKGGSIDPSKSSNCNLSQEEGQNIWRDMLKKKKLEQKKPARAKVNQDAKGQMKKSLNIRVYPQ